MVYGLEMELQAHLGFTVQNMMMSPPPLPSNWNYIVGNITEFLESLGSRSCDLDSNVSPYQLMALQSLYNSTNGDYWTNWGRNGLGRANNHWNFTGFDGVLDTHYPNPCNESWQGVSCLHNFTIQGVTFPGCTIIGLEITDMNLTGTIPQSVSYFQDLRFLELNFNSIHGTLPTELFSLSNLLYLNLYFNRLVGTISTSISGLSSLLFLGLMENHFTGTIPTEIGTLNLLELYLYDNSLIGPIPSELSNCHNISTLTIYGNYLTGTIPSEFTKLLNLFNLELSTNLLEGTIPTFLATMRKIVYLELSSNFFTGSVSPDFSNLRETSEFSLGLNYLTGPIFSELGNLQKLVTFSLFSNFMTSSVPVSISTISSLVNLLLHENLFSGRLDELYSNSSVDSLLVVDISNNGFTGPIPEGLLKGKNTVSIAMVKNCFQGTLPDIICTTGGNIVDLAMDGLSTGNACRQKISRVFGTFTSPLMDGTIPPCYFGLPALSSLQLSGNGFTGSLPSCSPITRNVTAQSNSSNLDLALGVQCASPLAPYLSVLILSHNRLTGTIPKTFQQFPFFQLDLSYNRLSGTTDFMTQFFTAAVINGCDAEPCNPSLVLEVNRLSGNMPSSFSEALNISILAGNLFGCAPNSYLPENDPAAATSQCGSSELYIVVTIYAGLLFPTLLIMLYCMNMSSFKISRRFVTDKLSVGSSQTVVLNSLSAPSGDSQPMRPDNDPTVLIESTRQPASMLVKLSEFFIGWKSAWITSTTVISYFPHPSRLSEYHKFVAVFLPGVRWFAIAVGCFAILFLIPAYTILKKVQNGKFASHSFEYGWTPSVAYLTGVAPGVFVLIVTLMITAVSSFLFLRFSEMLRRAKPSPRLRLHRGDASVSDDATASVLSSPSQLQEAEEASPFFLFSHFSKDLLLKWVIHVSRLVLVIAIDVFIMISANALFLLVLFRTSGSLAIGVQLALVLFKLVWNKSILPNILKRVHTLSNSFGSTSEDYYNLGLQTALLVFNNLLAPCIAIFATDKTCFFNVLVNSEPVSSYFDYNICSYVNGITGRCDIYSVIQVLTSFIPSFLYSFQCSSALLTTYTPIFILMYVYTAFIAPLVDQFRIYSCRADTLQSLPYLKKVIFQYSPLILRPIECSISKLDSFRECASGATANGVSAVKRSSRTSQLSARPSKQPPVVDITPSSYRDIDVLFDNTFNGSNSFDIQNSITSVSLLSTSSLETTGASRVGRPMIVNVTNIASGLICSTIILLTYGVGYPPLAIVVAFATVIETAHLQVLFGKYWEKIFSIQPQSGMLAVVQGDGEVHLSNLTAMQQELVSLMESTCRDVWRIVRQTAFMTTFSISTFFAFFVFDMIGDVSKSPSGIATYWIPLFMLFSPSFFFSCFYLSNCVMARRQASAPAETGSVDGLPKSAIDIEKAAEPSKDYSDAAMQMNNLNGKFSRSVDVGGGFQPGLFPVRVRLSDQESVTSEGSTYNPTLGPAVKTYPRGVTADVTEC